MKIQYYFDHDYLYLTLPAQRVVSSTLENGRRDGLSSNLWEFLSLIFIILKNIFIKEQNLAVPAAAGVPYFNKTLLTVELSTCAASLIFIIDYSVSLIFSMFNFGSIWRPHSWSSWNMSVIWFHSKNIPSFHM